jgi:hypothetical protein
LHSHRYVVQCTTCTRFNNRRRCNYEESQSGHSSDLRRSGAAAAPRDNVHFDAWTFSWVYGRNSFILQLATRCQILIADFNPDDMCICIKHKPRLFQLLDVLYRCWRNVFFQQ